jgi:Domain of unknown function (DUF397)
MEPHRAVQTNRGVLVDDRALAAAWRTSSLCDGPSDTCVEVAIGPSEVRVRDSKNPDGPTLRFTFGEWTAFLHGASHGEFEPPTR